MTSRYTPYARANPQSSPKKGVVHEPGCRRWQWQEATAATKSYYEAFRNYFDDFHAYCVKEQPQVTPVLRKQLASAVRRLKTLYDNRHLYCSECQKFKTYLKFVHQCDMWGFEEDLTHDAMKFEETYFNQFLKNPGGSEEKKKTGVKNLDPDFCDEDIRVSQEAEFQEPLNTAIPAGIPRIEEPSCLSCSC